MENMGEQLVTFKTAEFAKKNGFNCETRCYYNEDKSISYFRLTCNEHKEFCSAPTQSLLQKWLREKHNIDVESYLVTCVKGYHELYRKIYHNKLYQYSLYKNGIQQHVSINDNNLSYEDALENGLFEGLKLIKNETT